MYVHVLLCIFLCILSTNTSLGNINYHLTTCLSTDYLCFKRQYQQIKRRYLLGNDQFEIPEYKPYLFQYGNSQTCVNVSGLDNSKLIAISYDGRNLEFSMTIHSPLVIKQEVGRDTLVCDKSEFEFIVPVHGHSKFPLMRFHANVTIRAVFSFNLESRDNDPYLKLESPDVEMVVDIPDLSHYDIKSDLQKRVYEASEWAYVAIQHINAGNKIAFPFIDRYRMVTDRIPLKEFIQILPDETYEMLSFSFDG